MLGSLRSEIVCSRCSNNWMVGFLLAASFSGPAFSAPAFSFCRPHGLAQSHQPAFARLLLKTTSTQEGWGARLFREGRQTEDAQQIRKKKTMKTTSQKNSSELGSRAAQLSSEAPAAARKHDGE